MRLRSWLTACLSALRSLFAAYRFNPSAALYCAALWLIWSGCSYWSPPTARIVVGLILILTLFRSERAALPTTPRPPAR